MRRPFALLLLTLLPVLTGPAAADEIRFKNGDRLSGKLLSLDEGQIRFRSELAGELELPLSQVQTFATDEPIEIHLADEVLHSVAMLEEATGARPQGDDEPDEPRFRVPGTPERGPQSFRLADTIAINPEKGHAINWSGSLTAGGQFERGNSVTDEAHSFIELTRRGEVDRLRLRASYEGDRNTDRAGRGTTDTRTIRGSTQYDYFIGERLYLFQSNSGEKDGVVDLDLRLVIGAGTGFQWVERKDLEFSTDLGVAWTDEQYRDSAFDDDFVTGILRWNFHQRLGPIFSVFQRAEYRPSLEELDVMTVEATTGLRSDLTQTFFLEAKIVWEYDSEPSTGVDRQDVDYLFSLGYRFD